MKWILVLIACFGALPAHGQEPKVLVIVLDGLRPDYVTPSLMPHLHGLGQKGIVCDDHHAVFPTVTRVNSPSLATGAYPKTHGLMGNSVYFPEVDAKRSLSTSSAGNLKRVEKSTGGHLLTTTSIGEHLEASGKTILAVSSGSGGSAFLLNHKAKGGGVINTSVILPESQRPHILEKVGPVPPDATPNDERNGWAVDAYLRIGLDELHPDLTYLWLSDPDHTAHESGMGSAKTTEALRLVDQQIGRILQAHEERGLDKTINILVTSDHGFSTHIGGQNLHRLLRDTGLQAVTAGGAIYLKDSSDSNIELLVRRLQRTPWVGSIYTRATAPNAIAGFVTGTLSFDAVHWNHERAADVLVSVEWSDDEAAPGFRGTTALPGVAGHGTDSYYDIHATLIAAGPAFKSAIRSRVPTGNVDLAPTACRILGIPIPSSMDGRVLSELFSDGPEPGDVPVDERYDTVEAENYRLAISRSIVDDHSYVNWTRAIRE